MSKQHINLCKTQQKIALTFPNNYRSLTDIKDKEENCTLNSQTLPVCMNRKSCTVSVSPSILRDQLLGLLLESNSKPTLSLLSHLKTWVGDRWKDLKIQIANRINKLKYLQPSLMNETFASIEKQILIQWKKNTLLQGFQLLSNHTFTKESFANIQELKQFYNHIRVVITQIVYMLFQPCFDHLVQIGFPLEDRLYNHTAVTIITGSKEWPQIVDDIIKPHFFRTSPSFSQNYDLEELNARPQLINLQSQQKLFQATSQSIRKLEICYSSSSLIKTLNEYRTNLLQQIQQNIKNWRINHPKTKQIILQKEDILSCIIYTLVTGKHDNLGLSLKYMNFLYQDQIQNVMSGLQINSYRIDLEVACQYLCQPVVHLSIQDFGKLDSTTEDVNA